MLKIYKVYTNRDIFKLHVRNVAAKNHRHVKLYKDEYVFGYKWSAL